MDMVGTIGGSILALSLLTFVALFGHVPRLRNTPIGWAHRFICVLIPRFIRYIDTLVTGGRTQRSLSWLGNYLMYEKHPTVMILYLTLLTGSIIAFVPKAWPKMALSDKIILPILCFLPYRTLFQAVYTDPGIITEANHAAEMQLYPYDHVIFFPRHTCRTCKFNKPARSKHCKICKRCISRTDHHCIWINNCVGRNNHKYFLYFVLTTGIVLVYGSKLGKGLIDEMLNNTDFPRSMRPQAVLAPGEHWSKGMSWSAVLDALGFAMALEPRICGVTLLASMCTPMAWGFLAYHLYLLWAGTTTNETIKWSEVKDDIYDRWIYIADRYDGLDPTTLGTEVEPVIESWPKTTRQTVVRSETGIFDGSPNQDPAERAASEDPLAKLDWKHATSMKEIVNIYDAGFMYNLRDILSAPSKRLVA